MALTNIYLALNEVILLNVCEETTVKGFWDKLQNLYEGNSLTNKIFLRKKLYNLQMDKGFSLQ